MEKGGLKRKVTASPALEMKSKKAPALVNTIIEVDEQQVITTVQLHGKDKLGFLFTYAEPKKIILPTSQSLEELKMDDQEV